VGGRNNCGKRLEKKREDRPGFNQLCGGKFLLKNGVKTQRRTGGGEKKRGKRETRSEIRGVQRQSPANPDFFAGV